MAWHSAGHPHRAHVRAPGTNVTVEDETVGFERSLVPFGKEEEESDASPGASTSSARRFRTFSSYARHASKAENPAPAATGFEPATFEPAFGAPTVVLFSGRRYGSGGVPGLVPTAVPASQSAMDANAKHGATTPQTGPEPSPGPGPEPSPEPEPAPLLRQVLHGPLATPEKSTDPCT